MAARAESSVRFLQASLLALALMVGWLAGVDPKLAVVCVFGIGFAVLTVMNLTAGLCLFAVLTFLDSVISSSALSVTKLMGTLLVVSWLAKLMTDDDERDQPSFDHPVLLYGIALLIGWTAVSALWAEHAGSGDRERLSPRSERDAVPRRLLGRARAPAGALGDRLLRGRGAAGRRLRARRRPPTRAPRTASAARSATPTRPLPRSSPGRCSRVPWRPRWSTR